MDCLIAMCHVLSLVIFVTSCEQFIGERYAGPGRAMGREGNEELELELSAHLDTGESSQQSHGAQCVGGAGPESGNTRESQQLRQHETLASSLGLAWLE